MLPPTVAHSKFSVLAARRASSSDSCRPWRSPAKHGFAACASGDIWTCVCAHRSETCGGRWSGFPTYCRPRYPRRRANAGREAAACIICAVSCADSHRLAHGCISQPSLSKRFALGMFGGGGVAQGYLHLMPIQWAARDRPEVRSTGTPPKHVRSGPGLRRHSFHRL